MNIRKSLKNYFTKRFTRGKHITPITMGVDGEFSKVKEEYYELEDAIIKKEHILTIVECCDLIDVTVKFTFNKYKIPSPLIILFVYIRRPWKLVRNSFMQLIGFKKEEIWGIKNG